ncbi:unnamed protein product [Cyclocybe aegerita]|uniref:F-box domain-containing protein n=1 Tax=Cyclocybe aegerita TaxID=1973307 RepID=A0A8S0WMI4_CYCAE|nr:unnamed protein product [Cyclocybe aegerita]
MPNDVLSNLPNEILSSIFLCTLEKDSKQISEGLLAEVVISHVSSRWRAAALALPDLWSSFRFTGGSNCRTLPVDRLAAYLERSSNRLLDFWFDLREMDHGRWESGEPIVHFVVQTVPHVFRWHQFIVLLDGVYESFDFFEDYFKDLHAPNLEYFAIFPNQHEEQQVEVSAGSPEDLAPQIFLGGAPKLSALFLDTLGYSMRCMPPASNITTLTILRYDMVGDVLHSDVLYAILALPHIVNLALVGGICDDPIEHRVDMPNMKNLRLGDDIITPTLLLNLYAPLLEVLTISKVDLDFTDNYRLPDIEISKEPFPALHTLSLVDVSFRTSSWESRPILRQLTRCIKHLVISLSLEFDEEEWIEDYGSYEWNLETVSFNIEKPRYPYFYHTMSEILGEKVVVRLHKNILGLWQLEDPANVESLEKEYTVERMEESNPLRIGDWPAKSSTFGPFGEINGPFYLDILSSRQTGEVSHSIKSDEEAD